MGDYLRPGRVVQVDELTMGIRQQCADKCQSGVGYARGMNVVDSSIKSGLGHR